MLIRTAVCRLLLALLWTASVVHAQVLPGYGTRTTELGPAASAIVTTGDLALKEEEHEAATKHFKRALVHHPHSLEILSRLLQSSVLDADALRIWAHLYAAAAGDKLGRYRIDRALKKVFPFKDKGIKKLATLRAAAARELQKTAKGLKTKGAASAHNLLEFRFLCELMHELGQDSPALLDAAKPIFEATVKRFGAPDDDVINAVINTLEHLATTAQTDGDEGFAARARYILRGLAKQNAFGDLRGKRAASLEDTGKDAATGLARGRNKIATEKGQPLSIEQLEAMSPGARRKFSEDHGDETNPAYALSTTGRYLIQTTCGHDILLGCAKTVELHHRRLVDFYKLDPFKTRRGLIRIVPDRAGLESEGAPYWWAGGFQSGDVTTVSFACNTLEDLGRILTHELTHRFDGVLIPFQPTWLVEGKAVWTGGAYHQMRNPAFLEYYVDPSRFRSTITKGYLREADLQKLLLGQIAEYRDNYDAGFALYAFLATWFDDGTLMFGDALERYLQGVKRSPRNQEEWFLACFCDGSEGRPSDLKSFIKLWRPFLEGFDRENPPAWEKRYRRFRAQRRKGNYTYDRRTWIWQRRRAEPWLGQDHAFRTGRLLAERNRHADAIIAYSWALHCDEWPPRERQLFAKSLTVQNLGKAAWLIRRRLTVTQDTAYPALAKLPHLQKLLATYRELADSYQSEGLTLCASTIAAAHDRIAGLCHLPRINFALQKSSDRDRIHQIVTHRQLLGTSGWIEDDLLGYENRSGKPRFFEAPNLDLHVGRSGPPKSTGLLGKSPHQPVFVRSRTRQTAGRYRVGADIYFTTPLAEGALILGHTRRDRALAVEFSAGDYRMTRGSKQKRRPEWNAVQISIDSGFIRNGHLPGQEPQTRHEFDDPKPGFRLDVIVDGATVRVFVDQTEVLSFTTPNGLALDGYVGFAMHRGAVRLVEPIIEDLDWGLPTRAPGIVKPFDLANDGDQELSEIRNCRTTGIPLGEAGTFVIVIPSSERLASPSRLASASVTAVEHATKGLELEQSIAIAVPPSIKPEERTALQSAMQERFGARGRVLVHRRTSMPEDLPVILFVDAEGILRFSRPFPPADDKLLSHSIKHWAMAYRAPR